MKDFNKIDSNLCLSWYTLLVALIILTTTVHGQNVLSGRVINASKDSASVSGAVVKLQLMQAHGQMHRTIDSTRTDRRGHFRFRNISADSQATYFPTVDHHAVRYFGDAAVFKKSGDSRTSVVAVFDTTHSDKNLYTSMHHIFVDLGSDGAFAREVLILNNQGKRTIVAAADDSLADGATFGFTLPHGASAVEVLSGFTPNGHTVKGNRLLDFGVVVPGTKQVVYAYRLPFRNGLVAIHRQVDYDTRLFDLFIADQNLEVNSPDLEALGPFNIRNTVYQRFATENATRGERITFTVGGATGPLVPKSTAVIALTAIILITAVVSLNLTKKRADTRSDFKIFREEKQKLITEIADLDDRLANHKISSTKYIEERTALMDRLLVVERELYLNQPKATGARKI